MAFRNKLVLFDNYFDGYRRNYAWQTKLAVARHAGFDGIEVVNPDIRSPDWQVMLESVKQHGLTVLGFYWPAAGVVDADAGDLEEHTGRVEELVAYAATLGVDTYVNLGLRGQGELSGPTIEQRGSAKAQARHWERGVRLVSALDHAAARHGVPASLYPHIDWLCDTPQSVSRLLVDAGATHVTPAFTPLHWHLNANSGELRDVFELPTMNRLGYVALNNCEAVADSFRTVPLDLGEIDLAQVLGHLWARGYAGVISTQSYLLGGDPYAYATRAVNYVRGVQARFEQHPELNPAEQS